MSKKIIGYEILARRAIETESGVNIDDALRKIRSYDLVPGTGEDHQPDVELKKRSQKMLYLTRYMDGEDEKFAEWIWYVPEGEDGEWKCLGTGISAKDSWKKWSEEHNSSGTDDSVYIGSGSTTGSHHTVVVGNGNTIDSKSHDSSVFGKDNTVTNGTGNSVIGKDNNVTGTGHDVFGSQNTVSAFGSVVVGNNNVSSGSDNTLIGSDNSNGESGYGFNAILGRYNKVDTGTPGTRETGFSSIVGGQNTVQGAFQSTVLGESNKVKDIYQSQVVGQLNDVKDSEFTSVGGYNDKVSDANQVSVFGYSNVVDKGNEDSVRYETVVGNTNAVHGTSNAVFGVGSMVTGNMNMVASRGSVVTGNDNAVIQGGIQASTVSGDRNIVTGGMNSIGGYYNIVSTQMSNISGDHNIAFGERAAVTRDNTVTIGERNSATVTDETDYSGTDIVELGTSNTATNAANAYQLGRENTVTDNNLANADVYPHSMALNLGRNNEITGEGINIGKDNKSSIFGITLGQNNKADIVSIAAGQNMTAQNTSLAIGFQKKEYEVSAYSLYFYNDLPVGKWEEIDIRGSASYCDFAAFDDTTRKPIQVQPYLQVYNETTDEVRFYRKSKYWYESNNWSWRPNIGENGRYYGYLDDNGNVVQSNELPAGKVRKNYYYYFWYENNWPTEQEILAREWLGTVYRDTISLDESKFKPSNWTTYKKSETDQYVIQSANVIPNCYISGDYIFTGNSSDGIYDKFRVWGKEVDGSFVPWFNNNFDLSECITKDIDTSEIVQRYRSYDLGLRVSEETLGRPLTRAHSGGSKVIGELAEAEGGATAITGAESYLSCPGYQADWKNVYVTRYTYENGYIQSIRKSIPVINEKYNTYKYKQIDNYNVGDYNQVKVSNGGFGISAMKKNSDGRHLTVSYGALGIGDGMDIESGAIAIGKENHHIESGAIVLGKGNYGACPGEIIIGDSNTYTGSNSNPSNNGTVTVGINNRFGNNASSGNLVLGQYNSVGEDTNASPSGSVCVGQYNFIKGGGSAVFGRECGAKYGSMTLSHTGGAFSSDGSIVLGFKGAVAFYGSLTFGYQDAVSFYGGIAIGYNGINGNNGGIAIGKNGILANYDSINIGWSGGCADDHSIRLGFNGGLARNSSILIGMHAAAEAENSSIAIGRSDVHAKEASMALGFENVKGVNDSIAVGMHSTFAMDASVAMGIGSAAYNSSLSLTAQNYYRNRSGQTNPESIYANGWHGTKFFWYNGMKSGYVDVKLSGVERVRADVIHNTDGTVTYIENENGYAQVYKTPSGKYYEQASQIPLTEYNVAIRGTLDANNNIIPFFGIEADQIGPVEIPDNWIPVTWGYGNGQVYETTAEIRGSHVASANNNSAIFGGIAFAQNGSVAISQLNTQGPGNFNRTVNKNGDLYAEISTTVGTTYTSGGKTYLRPARNYEAIADGASIAIGAGTKATSASFSIGSFVDSTQGSLAMGYGGSWPEFTSKDYIGSAFRNSLLIAGVTGDNKFKRGVSDNGSIAIGRGNEAYDQSLSLGDENYSTLNSYSIGRNNTIGGWGLAFGIQNYATPRQRGAHAALIGYYNTSYSNLEEVILYGSSDRIPTTSFIAGALNTSNHYNSFLIGTKNTSLAPNHMPSEPRSGDSGRTTLDDGFVFALGYNNTVGRNYDIAIGRDSTANGGENIALFSSTVTGSRNFAINKSTILNGLANFAIGESYLSIPTNDTNEDGIKFNKNCDYNFLSYANVQISNTCESGFKANSIRNTTLRYESGVCFNRNTINIGYRSSDDELIINTNKFTDNIVFGNKESMPLGTGYENVPIRLNGESELSGEYYRNVLINDCIPNVVIGGENFLDNVVVSSDLKIDHTYAFHRNIVLGGSVVDVLDNSRVLDNVLLSKSSIYLRDAWSDFHYANQFNFAYNSVMTDSSVGGYDKLSGTPYVTQENVAFGSRLHGTSNSFSFSDNNTLGDTNRSYFYDKASGEYNSKQVALIAGCNRIYNFGDNYCVHSNSAFVEGLDNNLFGTENSIVLGKSNTITGRDGYGSGDPIVGNTVIGEKNKIYSTTPATKVTSTYIRENQAPTAEGKHGIYKISPSTLTAGYKVPYSSVSSINLSSSYAYVYDTGVIARTTPSDITSHGLSVTNISFSVFNSQLTAGTLVPGKAYVFTDGSGTGTLSTSLFDGVVMFPNQDYSITSYGAYDSSSQSTKYYGQIIGYDSSADIVTQKAKETFYNTLIGVGNELNARYSNFNTIFGSGNRVKRYDPISNAENFVTNCNNNFVFGYSNTLHQNTMGFTVIGASNEVISSNLTINESSYSGQYAESCGFVQGNDNISKNGSNTVVMGNGNVADGHNAVAIGCQLIANKRQTVIGKYNQPIIGTDRLDGQNPQNPEAALFIIGNGYSTVDNSNWKNEGYITRSNAMVVYADGTVKAKKFVSEEPELTLEAGDGISFTDDLQQNTRTISVDQGLQELAALLANKPAQGTWTIQSVDGVLSWTQA